MQTTPTSAGDRIFYVCLGLLGGAYVVLIVLMIFADCLYTTPDHVAEALAKEEIRFSIALSLVSCSMAALLSLWVAIPLGYLLSRTRFPGRGIVDTLLDVPIVLPPLVIGLSLLILFHTGPGRWFEEHVLPVTYRTPSVILAQFAVAAAFAVRTMRVTFEQISPRREEVAARRSVAPAARHSGDGLMPERVAPRHLTAPSDAGPGPGRSASSGRSSSSRARPASARRCCRRPCSSSCRSAISRRPWRCRC